MTMLKIPVAPVVLGFVRPDEMVQETVPTASAVPAAKLTSTALPPDLDTEETGTPDPACVHVACRAPATPLMPKPDAAGRFRVIDPSCEEARTFVAENVSAAADE